MVSGPVTGAGGALSCALQAAEAAVPGGGLGLAATLLVAGLLSGAVALVLTPAVRRLALRVGAVDHPGSDRIHRQPVPFLGGLALLAGLALGLAVVLGLGGLPAAEALRLRGLLLGGLAITVVGVVDDLGTLWARRFPGLADADGRGLRPVVKLAGQIGAALVLCVHGVTIAGVHVPLSRDPCSWVGFAPWASWPLTVLWVVTITNAVNLIDGLDGLAAGVSAISAATLLVLALLMRMDAAALAAGVLLAACLGFLPFNFHPARIFMGDAGALLLGFALSGISVVGPMKGSTVITLAVPVLALGLPVFDTLMAVVRRWRSGRLVGTRDRSHVHHRLLDLGLSHRDAVLSLYVVSGWLGISALAVESVAPALGLVILGFVVASAALGARLAGVAGAARAERRATRSLQA
jgi:UDP-GlcNAc:undecaprenyl-phosphate GlcNAc-1-phosphate transferase